MTWPTAGEDNAADGTPLRRFRFSGL